MPRLSIWIAGSASRFPTILAMAAVLGVFASAGPGAGASSVVVEISGTFGYFTYGNYPAPLDNGSFLGTVTFSSLPGPNQTVLATTADVNFYTSTNQLLFTVGGGGYDPFTAGPSGYETLGLGGDVSVGGTPVSVSGLSLSFNNWSIGSPSGTVQPYGAGNPADYGSAISYTYYPDGINQPGTTYYDPVVMGQASVPEPSTLALGLVGMVGALIYARGHRRKAIGRPIAATAAIPRRRGSGAGRRRRSQRG